MPLCEDDCQVTLLAQILIIFVFWFAAMFLWFLAHFLCHGSCHSIEELRLEACKELGIREMLAEPLLLCVDGASDTVPMKLEFPKQLVSTYSGHIFNIF
jgi:predicted metal-binding protein